jgi:ribosomal protein S18 acetylase RimI-like enzyme
MDSVRKAVPADLDRVGELAAKLVRFHHEMDPKRYLEPPSGVARGYRDWLAGELAGKATALVVAERGGAIVGYALGRLEGRDWMRLLDAHGELHDVWIEDDARGSGLAQRMVVACVEELERLGAPRVVLSTGAQNERAQRFFAKLGFRPTMIEMTRSR